VSTPSRKRYAIRYEPAPSDEDPHAAWERVATLAGSLIREARQMRENEEDTTQKEHAAKAA
jgi:hypothetical protein